MAEDTVGVKQEPGQTQTAPETPKSPEELKEAGAEAGADRKEVEELQVHPVNRVDSILHELATDEYRDDPRVQAVLREMSDELFKKALEGRAYFKGEASDSQYPSGVDKTTLRPAGITAVYYADSLQKLGSYSEDVAEAIARKLGAIPQGHTLSELEIINSKVLQPPDSQKQSYTNRWVAIPLTNAVQNPPLSNDGMDLRESQYPVVILSKQYINNDSRAGQPGGWSLGISMRPNIYEQSLDLPLSPSKFPAQSTTKLS